MANQTQILNVSDEMKYDVNVQTKNVKEQEENMYSSSSDTTEELCSSSTNGTCGDCGSTTPSKADCRIPKQSNIRRAIGEHEKCNRKQQQDSGCGFRRQKRRLAIPFVFDKQ